MKLHIFANGGSRRRAGLASLALGAAAALALGGCSAGYVENSDAPVMLVITAINEGAVLDSDIRIGAESATVCEDEVAVTVRTQPKNPNSPLNEISTVLLRSYEVRFFRTDGRGVEGIDVPYRITGNLAASVEETTSVPIEVVRRQAKLEPPLSAINQASVLTVMAQVTIYGETISGKKVSASGRFQIDFADFGDDNDSCPTSGN
jgi:hypothetical protein